MIGLFLAACLRTHSGTAVGNPGDLDAKASRAADGFTLDAVEVPVGGVVLAGCGAPGVAYDWSVTLDGMAPSPEPVPVPGGPWCGVELVLDGPVVVSGATDAGTAFTVALAPSLAVDGRLDIDGETLLLDLPLAIDAGELDRLGPDVTLGVEDPLAELWAADALPSLYEDTDRDGVLSAPDRILLRPVALHTGGLGAALASPSDAGCGCASDRGGASLAALLAAGLFARRTQRRRRAATTSDGSGGTIARPPGRWL